MDTKNLLNLLNIQWTEVAVPVLMYSPVLMLCCAVACAAMCSVKTSGAAR